MRTKEDLIEQALEEMPEVEFIAQDEDGVWYAYSARPYMSDDSFQGNDSRSIQRLDANGWKNSIIEIPKKENLYRWKA